MASMVSITPYMMMPGNSKIVAERLYAVMSKPPHFEAEPLPQGAPASVGGQWEATIEYTRGSAIHNLIIEQHGDKLVGTHQGETVSGDLSGAVAANLVRFRSSQRIQGTRLSYDFTGTVNGDTMSGDVNLGEYGAAKWTARRHQYKSPRGVIRPVKRA
jgi:L-seryl-tRNA(Ser) seleniumtransferase